jgi:uncharacterized protein YbjT (DUF2867 family)
MTKFQPVFVGDMTAGLVELLKRPETAGKTYEFGGPQVYSFKVLLELLLTALNRQRVLIPVPFALAEMQAGLLELPLVQIAGTSKHFLLRRSDFRPEARRSRLQVQRSLERPDVPV